MVLITGGAFSGLEAFAKQYDAKHNRSQSMQIVYISNILVEKEDKAEPLEITLQRWSDENKINWNSLILIHEEVGCGLIPDTRQKREQREKQGRAGCFFGEKATEVYRVCCGLGIKIK